jgi:hypothetical protein
MEETLSKSSATNPTFVHVILVFIIYELFYKPSGERVNTTDTWGIARSPISLLPWFV